MFKRIFVLREGSARAKQGSLLAARIARVSGGTVILSPEISTQEPPGSFEMTQAPGGDLVLISGPGCAGFEPWMLERVAQRTASYPPMPVLILREGKTVLSSAALELARSRHPPRTAVALDGSRQAETAILPAAHLTAALAAPARGSLHLTRVVLRPDIDACLHDRVSLDPHQRDQIMREAMDYLHRTTDNLRAYLEGELGLTITWSIALDSDVVNALVSVAEQSHVIGGTCLFGGCDLLALGTHSRDSKGYWVPGDVTGRLFTSTDLPLFLV